MSPLIRLQQRCWSTAQSFSLEKLLVIRKFVRCWAKAPRAKFKGGTKCHTSWLRERCCCSHLSNLTVDGTHSFCEFDRNKTELMSNTSLNEVIVALLRNVITDLDLVLIVIWIKLSPIPSPAVSEIRATSLTSKKSYFLSIPLLRSSERNRS